MYMLHHFITRLYVIPNCIILPPHKSLNYKHIFLFIDSFFVGFLVNEKPLNLKVLILPRFPFSWSDSPPLLLNASLPTAWNAETPPAHVPICLHPSNDCSDWGEWSTMQLTYGSCKAWPCRQRQLQPLALCLKTGARTPAPATGG